MKAAIFVKPGEMTVKDVEKPVIEKKTDAIIRVLRACVCGSDLWWYRGIAKREQGSTVGHEAIGIVEEVGDDVTAVKPGDTTVVIGDGAVGLCGVIGARLRGAKRVILMSHHADRAALGKEFGATDIVSERGDDAVKKVMELTQGRGADSVQECVGAISAIEQAGQVARPGAIVGRVGVPQTEPASNQMFWKNIGLRGGIASVTTYDKNVLLKAVLDGRINPGKVFTKRFDLDHVQDAYAAMDKREAIKSLLIVSEK